MITAVNSGVKEYPVQILITDGMYKYFLSVEEAKKLKSEIEKIIGVNK